MGQKGFEAVQGDGKGNDRDSHPVGIFKESFRVFGHEGVHVSDAVQNDGPAGGFGEIFIGRPWFWMIVCIRRVGTSSST